MTEKVVGYILICVGVGIILFSGLSVYQVFTKRAEPVLLFSFPALSIDMSKMLSGALPKEIRDTGYTLPPSKQEILSADMVNQPTNLLFHTVLMGFMVTVGFKIASIGTMMVRTIVVKVKEEEGKK